MLPVSLESSSSPSIPLGHATLLAALGTTILARGQEVSKPAKWHTTCVTISCQMQLWFQNTFTLSLLSLTPATVTVISSWISQIMTQSLNTFFKEIISPPPKDLKEGFQHTSASSTCRDLGIKSNDAQERLLGSRCQFYYWFMVWVWAGWSDFCALVF